MTDTEIVAEIIEAWRLDTDWAEFGRDVCRVIGERMRSTDGTVEKAAPWTDATPSEVRAIVDGHKPTEPYPTNQGDKQ